jgi:putative Mn2+ efflux pump MntP
MLGPLLLIVLGVLFLLNNMFPGVFRFGKMWPVILIVIGLVKVLEYFQGHSQKTEDKKENQ